jgi:xylulokinase
VSRGYFLSIDLGTQSNRAALVDFNGNIVVSIATSLEMVSPAPGWAEQDACLWWDTTVANIRNLFSACHIQPEEVVAVGVCGQMHAAIPLDKRGDVLLRAVQMWCDKRSAYLIDEIEHSLPVDIISRVGNIPTPAWWGWKLHWIKVNQPEVYQRTWKFLTLPGYLGYKLTGEVSIDLSEASGSFLMDVNKQEWSADVMAWLDLDKDKLPPIYASSAVLGVVNYKASQETGLREGMIVAVGAGDMLNSLLAAGLTHSGQAVDITGTSTIINIFSEQPVLDNRLMNLHHSLPGWITFGISDTGGGALKWFKDGFCQDETNEARGRGISPYRVLDEKAAQIAAGSEGLLFYPYLLGERTLGSPYSRGVFFGLTPRSEKGALARAIMEGIVFEMRRTLDIVEASGVVINEIRSVGGGAQSRLWCQIRADIYQKPVAVMKNFEGGILGSAILAGVAAEVYSDASIAAQRLVQIEGVHEPNLSLASLYRKQFAVYQELHDQMQSSFERMAGLISLNHIS